MQLAYRAVGGVTAGEQDDGIACAAAALDLGTGRLDELGGRQVESGIDQPLLLNS